MTFQTWVKDDKGQPVINAYVQANVEETGASFTRFTDGRGYADVAVLTPVNVGDHVTFIVQADGFKINPQYLTITPGNQEVQVTLVPFV